MTCTNVIAPSVPTTPPSFPATSAAAALGTLIYFHIDTLTPSAPNVVESINVPSPPITLPLPPLAGTDEDGDAMECAASLSNQQLRRDDFHEEREWVMLRVHTYYNMFHPLIEVISRELFEAKKRHQQEMKLYLLHDQLIFFLQPCLASLQYGTYLIGIYLSFPSVAIIFMCVNYVTVTQLTSFIGDVAFLMMKIGEEVLLHGTSVNPTPSKDNRNISCPFSNIHGTSSPPAVIQNLSPVLTPGVSDQDLSPLLILCPLWLSGFTQQLIQFDGENDQVQKMKIKLLIMRKVYKVLKPLSFRSTCNRKKIIISPLNITGANLSLPSDFDFRSANHWAAAFFPLSTLRLYFSEGFLNFCSKSVQIFSIALMVFAQHLLGCYDKNELLMQITSLDECKEKNVIFLHWQDCVIYRLPCAVQNDNHSCGTSSPPPPGTITALIYTLKEWQ
jgi:hypothetical protein